MTVRVFLTALAIALTLSSASAQVGGMGGGGRGGHHQKPEKTAKTQKQPRADENAYRAALKTIPDKHFDAWNGIR